MNNYNPLKKIVELQKAGDHVGIYSCCSANRYVIEAAIEKGIEDGSCVLIESTANQSDQYGGYTGMKPLDFRNFVLNIAQEKGLPENRLFLGGDHLGPLTWTKLNEKEAMENAEELIRCYVGAGFTKIHIDTSMKVADDDPEQRLSDEIISKRGAHLAKIANETYKKLLETDSNAVRPVYIVGSEVPIPGGAQEDDDKTLQVTKVSDFKATVSAFEKAFIDEGIADVWNDVIAVVVQPGVEEKDAGCTEYDRSKAADLMESIKDYPKLVFEGHSTDYQTKYKLKELIEDGVGILKVGPGLTYAMREGLFALAYMEDMILHGKDEEKSDFIDILEKAMLAEPKSWIKHYHGDADEQWFKRKFSFSDRSRYYMPEKTVETAKDKLILNLRRYGVSLAVLSQFMPRQYTKVREGTIENDPEVLIKDHIKDTIDEYLYASRQKELF